MYIIFLCLTNISKHSKTIGIHISLLEKRVFSNPNGKFSVRYIFLYLQQFRFRPPWDLQVSAVLMPWTVTQIEPSSSVEWPQSTDSLFCYNIQGQKERRDGRGKGGGVGGGGGGGSAAFKTKAGERTWRIAVMSVGCVAHGGSSFHSLMVLGNKDNWVKWMKNGNHASLVATRHCHWFEDAFNETGLGTCTFIFYF